MNDISSALWNHLKETGGVQADIARAVGCSNASVGNWLHRNENPRPKWHVGIARYLGWSVEDVLRAGGYLPANGNGHGDPNATELERLRGSTIAALSDLDLFELGVVNQLARVLREGRARRQDEGPSPTGTGIQRPLSRSAHRPRLQTQPQ